MHSTPALVTSIMHFCLASVAVTDWTEPTSRQGEQFPPLPAVHLFSRSTDSTTVVVSTVLGQ